MYKSLIDGIGNAIYGVLGDQYEIYGDNIEQGFDEPCFFIDLIDGNRTRELNIRHSKVYSMDIRYHDTNSSIDEKVSIAELLCEILEVIPLELEGDMKYVRGSNISYEIEEGVLHFFITYILRFEKNVGKMDKMSAVRTNSEVNYGD